MIGCTRVPPTHIMNVLPKAAKLLDQAIQATEGHEVCGYLDVISDLQTGAKQLWIGVDEDNPTGPLAVVVVTEMTQHPKARQLTLLYCAGKEITEWVALSETLEQYAKENGCHFMVASGRMGWKPFLEQFGWRRVAAIYEKEIAYAG